MTRFALALGLVAASPVAAQDSITPARIAAHVAVLAHDSLRGRATPSPGLEAAAAYVAEGFRAAGLSAIGGADFVTRWPLVTRRRLPAEVRLIPADARLGRFVYGEDFAVMAAGVPEVRGRIVEVPRLDGIGLRGRIPLLRVAGSEWQAPSHAAIRAARRAGAIAVFLVFDSIAISQVAETGIRMDHSATGVPAVVMTRGAARRLLGTQRHTAPRVTLLIPEAADTAPAPAVVGLLPGRDPRLAREHVVVTAHLDHLGVGAPDERGDSIYNGADDNASGVAALLEIARVLGESAEVPARSVIFLATSAEEVCICGSEQFTREPPVPLESLVAALNLDGIGRSWQRDTVSAVGSIYSSLGGTVRAVNARHPELGLTVVDDQWPDRSYFQTSDQIWFARRGVPALFLSSTGPDAHYHRRSDESGTVEPEVTARIARLAAGLVRDVADAPAPPTWAPEARAELALPR